MVKFCLVRSNSELKANITNDIIKETYNRTEKFIIKPSNRTKN